MSRVQHVGVVAIVTVTFLFGVLTSGTASAQDPLPPRQPNRFTDAPDGGKESPAPEKGASTPSDNGSSTPTDNGSSTPKDSGVATTLFLLVRVTGEFKRSTEDWERLMTQGAEVSKCTFDKPAEVQKVSGTVFRMLQQLTSNPTTELAAADSGLVQLRELPTGDKRWEFRFAPDAGVLKELEVEYRSGSRKYTPQQQQSQAAPVDLEMVLRGTYALRVDANAEPLKYRAVCKALPGTGSEEKEYKGEWPVQDEFFSIKLRNFRGDRQLLLKTIMKPEDGSAPAVPNALDDVQLGQDTLIAIASLGDKLQDPGKEFDKNIYLARAGAIPGQRVDRVWMLFPLTEAEYHAQYDKLSKLGVVDLVGAIDDANSEANQQPYKLTAAEGPKWFELTASDPNRKDRFERQFLLGDGVEEYQALQQKYPRAWRLLVWEFNNGGIREPQGVKHPNGGRVFVLDEEIKAWPTELRRLAGEKNAPTVEKKNEPKKDKP